MTDRTPDQLTIPADLLNLSDIKVVDLKVDHKNHEIVINVVSTKEIIPCRQCNKPTASHGYGRPLRLRHLPILGKITMIGITPRRGICHDCDGDVTTTEKLDWYDFNSKQTKPYEQHLLFELVNSTVADVSRKEGIDCHTIDSLVERHIETKVDFSLISSLGVLGLDEISLKKGHKDFVTLISYRTNDKVQVLAVIKGREKAEILAFLSTIPDRLQKTILVACCDLYEGYMNACKEAFKGIVPVVADRFHVRRLYRKSLVQLRKSELKRLKKTITEVQYKELKPAIALLMKHKDYFEEDEKLMVEPLFALSPKLKKAYDLSRKLSGIFDSEITPTVAKEKMAEWMLLVLGSGLTCFDSFIKSLRKYMMEICNYFIAGDSSGFVEGFNNKVKVLKRRCYGLSNATKLFQRLIIDTVGFARFAPPAILVR